MNLGPCPSAPLNLERDPEFQRIIDEARASGRATLRRLQWQRANGGSDTMLIWLGKQMLGQKDKVETEATNTHHVSGAFVLIGHVIDIG